MTVLGVDPGKRALAWAVVSEEAGVVELVGCGITKTSRGAPWDEDLPLRVKEVLDTVNGLDEGPPDLVVVELPRVYPGDRRRRPNDLIDLAAAAGACAGLAGWAPFRFVWPATWKGQAPKGVVAERTKSKVRCGGRWPRNHNILDAIGIALWGVEQGRKHD